MSESENEIVSYHRTQKGPWGLLLYAVAVVLLTVTWPVPNVPTLPVALGVIVFVVLGTSLHQLTVADEGRQLDIHFGPFPLFGGGYGTLKSSMPSRGGPRCWMAGGFTGLRGVAGCGTYGDSIVWCYGWRKVS